MCIDSAISIISSMDMPVDSPMSIISSTDIPIDSATFFRSSMVIPRDSAIVFIFSIFAGVVVSAGSATIFVDSSGEVDCAPPMDPPEHPARMRHMTTRKIILGVFLLFSFIFFPGLMLVKLAIPLQVQLRHWRSL